MTLGEIKVSDIKHIDVGSQSCLFVDSSNLGNNAEGYEEYCELSWEKIFKICWEYANSEDLIDRT